MSTTQRLFVLLVLTAGIGGCGTNPVTGKKEVQFVSESSEIRTGAQQYAPSRQSQGGDFKMLPELSAYVSEVGQKLAAVSERQLPYEFTVLNSSVPNAWALPGGKIAVNRGLLVSLENEAELAAVLSHEIVHAAARHGAKAQERGTFLQAGMVAAQIGIAMRDPNSQLGNLALQGAGLGAELVMMKYGREAELEADKYGINYMHKVGYDTNAAVSLQEKFLKLSQAGGKRAGWLDGLFASHPPSEERVAKNRVTADAVGTGGELKAPDYKARVAPLLAMQPAYEKADAALVAAAKKDLAGAKALATEAARMLPREARFQQLLGDLALSNKEPQAALPYYEKAIALDSSYFGPYLGAGVASYKLGNKAKAEQWLTQSNQLLPTAPGLYYLGVLAKESGNVERALELYRGAAESQSEIGQRAAAEYAALDLSRNPGNYIATAAQTGTRGELVLVLENRAPVALSEIAVTPVLVDVSGRILQQARVVSIGRALQPGERIAVDAGVGQVSPELLQQIRFRIDSAKSVQQP